MKKYGILIALIMGMSISVYAQKLPLNNQYLLNKFSLNPSYAGIESGINVFAGYRNQWVGIEGTPITKMFSAYSGLGNNVAIGGEVISDQEGMFTRLYAGLTYSYQVKLTDEHILSFGLTGRVFEHSISLTDVVIDNPLDPVLNNRVTQNETVLNAGGSILYNFKGFNVGFNVPYILNNKSQFNAENNVDEYLLRRHYIGHISFDIPVSDDFKIEPFGIFRFTEYAPMNFEFASLFKYKEQVWLGASYRREGNMGLSAGFNVNKKMALNYTYEFLGKGMTGQSDGTHEFALGLYLGRGLKKLKANQLALSEKADSLSRISKELENELSEEKKVSAAERAKTNAKIDQLQQRLSDAELEMAKLKNYTEEQKAAKKKEIDKEILDIEKQLQEVGGQFFVVVEAFKIPENAERSIELWRIKGLEVKMIFNEVRDFYYIYVGKYPTYNDALRVKTTLKDNGIFGWIYLWKK
ncbi:MAG: PorP/SprF family type IX secretion system membrane protein [Bacteroidetes bacterium]|nr:PorP/SprF family type IX secretion system membrane protein [Bacteroidota bacterium]